MTALFGRALRGAGFASAVFVTGIALWVGVWLVADYDAGHTLRPHPPHWILASLSWAPAPAQLAYVIPLAKWAYRVAGSAGGYGVWAGATVFAVINVLGVVYVLTSLPD